MISSFADHLRQGIDTNTFSTIKALFVLLHTGSINNGASKSTSS